MKSSVTFIVVVTPDELLSGIARAGLSAAEPAPYSNGFGPQTTTGAVSSVTITVAVQVASLPPASVTVTLTEFSPKLEQSNIKSELPHIPEKV